MSSFLDQTPGSRDLAARSDGARVLHCRVKNGPIAAARCVEQQAAGCFCLGAFGALKGYEATLGEDFERTRETPEDKARRAAGRVQLVALKARAAGFARQPEGKQFAGPALSVENERRRRAKLAAVEEVPDSPPPPAPAPLPLPPSIAPRPPVAEVAAAVEAQREKAQLSPKPAPDLPVRSEAKPSRFIPCPKCGRVSQTLRMQPDPKYAEGKVSICGRCIRSLNQSAAPIATSGGWVAARRVFAEQAAKTPGPRTCLMITTEEHACGWRLKPSNKSGLCTWHSSGRRAPRPREVSPPLAAPPSPPADPSAPLVECPKCHRLTRQQMAVHPKFDGGPVCGNCQWNLTHSKEPEDRVGGPRLGWRPCATQGCSKQVQKVKGHDTCSYCRSGSRAHLSPAGEMLSLRSRVVELEALLCGANEAARVLTEERDSLKAGAAKDYERLHRELLAVEAEREALRLQLGAPKKDPGQDDEIDTIRALLSTISRLTAAGRTYLRGRIEVG